MSERIAGAPPLSEELQAAFAKILGVKSGHSTTVLTEEFDKLFRSCGCDPHCHFCLKPLAVGAEFGFMKLAKGINGTACVNCIKEERLPPRVEALKAEQRARSEASRGQHAGFLLVEDTND